MRIALAALGASLAVLPALPVHAAPFMTFTDSTCNGQTTCVKSLTDASATATFANPLVEMQANVFYQQQSLGLGLGSGGIGYQWTVTFDATVTLIGVELGFVLTNDGFDVAGAGVAANDLLAGAGLGVHALGPLTFLANETYTFTSNNLCNGPNGCGAVLFKNWEFQGPGVPGTPNDPGSANVPEPGTLAMLGLGMAGFVVSRRRRS